ncbi:hypothetical protein CgunFtcFv8_011188 [Champsocephalus gunnari]|nr:hypothetical protein CgunFtcFv8_011188 [Champsocephalus gunnari]
MEKQDGKVRDESSRSESGDARLCVIPLTPQQSPLSIPCVKLQTTSVISSFQQEPTAEYRTVDFTSAARLCVSIFQQNCSSSEYTSATA